MKLFIVIADFALEPYSTHKKIVAICDSKDVALDFYSQYEVVSRNYDWEYLEDEEGLDISHKVSSIDIEEVELNQNCSITCGYYCE